MHFFFSRLRHSPVAGDVTTTNIGIIKAIIARTFTDMGRLKTVVIDLDIIAANITTTHIMTIEDKKMILIIAMFILLYVPALLIVLAIKERNAKANKKLIRIQNIDDMKEALASAAEASGGCGYSGKRQA